MVLDRNKPVARLVPYANGEVPMSRRLQELQQSGLLTQRTAAQPNPLPPPVKLKQPVDVSRFILEDRARA